MKKSTLPKDIKQLVDKKNYVIAIKTLSERDNISLEAAKQRIDNYEANQHAKNHKAKSHKVEKATSKKTKQKTNKEAKKATNKDELNNPNDLSSLVNSVDNTIAKKGISTRIPTHWFRLGQLLVLLLLLGCLFYIVFIR